MDCRILARKILPEASYDSLKLFATIRNSKKSYAEIERIVDRDYFKLTKRHIDWCFPKTYTEKINFSKIYCATEEKTKLSDKIAVREWIAATIGSDYLVPLLGIYDCFSDIDFSKLPEKFVIKCNHDSNSVTVIRDKNTLTPLLVDKLRKKYDNFLLKRNYAFKGFEMHYSSIKPKIIIEKYLGNNICDYKFLCFGGSPYFCWIDLNRFTDHKRNVYDLDWNLQPFNQMTYGNFQGIVKKPSAFDEMVNISRILCQGFDHVRIDLYEIDRKVYFGEMTFTNGNGSEVITPDVWDYKLGNMWSLDISQRNKTLQVYSGPRKKK